jgi:sialic acid synthase SpsE
MKKKLLDLDKRSKPYFIAEIGVNHEGSMQEAKKLIVSAKRGGADAVKFQTYKAEKIAAKNSPYYWDIKKEKTKSQFELFSKYDKFDFEHYKILASFCKKKKIEFLSTPFDLDAVNFLNPLVRMFKISSSDITNLPLLEAVASKKKITLLSTGASSISEIRQAVKILSKKVNKIVLMHCILNYPTTDQNANLNMIKSLQSEFPKCISGYSDHTMPQKNMQNLVTAYLFGAKVIEKHFTINKKKEGNDHYHSLDEKDLKIYTQKIKAISMTLGSNKKQFLNSEIKSRKYARRSLVINKAVQKGHKLTKNDLICKRPATGVNPMFINAVLGKKVTKDLKYDTILNWKHLKK